jgi:hypothetical protein
VLLFFSVIRDEQSFVIKGLCYPSQKKNRDCYKIRVDVEKEPLAVINASCECPVGRSEGCGHICGLLYTFAGHQAAGLDALPMDVAKTSQPQTWHVPRGNTIPGKPVHQLEVKSYNKHPSSDQQKCIKSTLSNPLRTAPPNPADLHDAMRKVHPKCMALDIMKNNHTPTVQNRLGMFPKGSPLSYQHSLNKEYHINLMDNTGFPSLPVNNVMNNNLHLALTENQQTTINSITISSSEAAYFEEKTRLQSETALWHKVREFRLTASKFGSVARRQKADVTKLIERLKATRNVQTQAMKDGLAREPLAAEAYVRAKDMKVNLYPCGCVVSVSAPWLAASPDRKVYDPSKPYPYGLLEIKCPEADTVAQAQWLKEEQGVLVLKKNHDYFYQVLAQLAVSGLPWCDFFTWCHKDNSSHCETIMFDQYKDEWQEAKDKVDIFLFSHFFV